MKPVFLLLLLSISSLLLLSTPKVQSKKLPNCPSSHCNRNGPQIRFPFHLSKPNRCGYTGFDLSCNKNNQTIVTLPNSSGHFIVTHIDYKKQSLFINDPDHCLPNRILKTINLTGSPFRPAYLKKFIFYNCSSQELKSYVLYHVVPIPCLSDQMNSNYTLVVTDNYYVPFMCRRVMSVSVPVGLSVYRYDTWDDLTEDLMLTWREPQCGACEAAGGSCGFKNYGSTEEIECFDIPNSGLSRNATYAMTLGIGVPGLVCLIGFICYSSSRFRAHGPNHQTGPNQPSPSITRQPAQFITGLDGPTINSYPKTILGDSGRLPKPNDGTCSICLADYLPKDILRSIPECNHYFHASCIDEWLKMNSTCPLCRNSPSGSLAETPYSSLSLSSSLSASSP